jgi:nucleotide exchange factor SIL1
MEAAVSGHCRRSFSKLGSLISLSFQTSTMTRRRFLRRSSSSLWICFACLILLAACIIPSLLSADAKEVVATKDWTLLGENDTVAAGMHIRMDLATGQKWVKLPSTENDDNNNARDKKGDAPDVNKQSEDTRTTSNQRQATSISSSSSAVAVSVNGESTAEADNPVDESDDSEEAPYDYDMMHRTLSQLPDEERARIALPEAPQSGMTDEQRAVFEGRMRHIWLQRQEELKRFEQEFVADMPQILRDRIVRLQQYVNDPYQELLEMSNEPTAEAENGPHEDSSPVVTHIVSVLADLEYHLSDIDMTRDFYTLGGWPLLVSMLHDGTHAPNANHTAAVTGHDMSPVSDAVHHVQAHAAWALGTAVKNTGEFAPFVVEPLQLIPGHAAPTMSALQVLLDQLSSVDLVDASKPLLNKVHKYLYALGSFVRGNPLAQRQFVALHGTKALEGLVDMHVPTVSLASSRKIVHRVVSIVDDLVRETSDPNRQQQHPHVDGSDDLVRGISTPVWCESTSTLLATTRPTAPSAAASILHPALRLAGATAPRCQHTDPDWSHRVRGSASNLLRHWHDESKSNAEAADLDELNEGIDLAQSVLAVLDSTASR